MNGTSKRILAIGIPLATVAATGIAFATWTGTGGGVGGASASNASGSLTASGTTGSADLYPGLTAGSTTGGDLILHVVNSKPYAVQFTTVTPGGVGSYSATPSTCTDDATPTAGPAVTMPAAKTISAVVVPASSSADVTVHHALSMAVTADNSCQDATFSIPVTLS